MKHLSYEKRMLIKQYLGQGKAKGEIAQLIGVSLSTVYREIKKGSVIGEYQPLLSQMDYEHKLKTKGQKSILLQNKELAKVVSELILKEHLSPKQVIKRLRELGYESPTATRTIYMAIDNNLIPNVGRNDLRSKEVSVHSKGLIQLPNWVREELKIKDGDKLRIDVRDGDIIISH